MPCAVAKTREEGRVIKYCMTQVYTRYTFEQGKLNIIKMIHLIWKQQTSPRI